MHQQQAETHTGDTRDAAAKDDALIAYRAARAAHEHAHQAADHAWNLAEHARQAWDEARNRGWSDTALSRSGCHRLPDIRWRPTSNTPMPRPGAG